MNDVTPEDRDGIDAIKETARRRATEILHECNVTSGATYEIMHAVVAVAYLRGHQDGMTETVAVAHEVFGELDPRDFT